MKGSIRAEGCPHATQRGSSISPLLLSKLGLDLCELSDSQQVSKVLRSGTVTVLLHRAGRRQYSGLVHTELPKQCLAGAQSG